MRSSDVVSFNRGPSEKIDDSDPDDDDDDDAWVLGSNYGGGLDSALPTAGWGVSSPKSIDRFRFRCVLDAHLVEKCFYQVSV